MSVQLFGGCTGLVTHGAGYSSTQMNFLVSGQAFVLSESFFTHVTAKRLNVLVAVHVSVELGFEMKSLRTDPTKQSRSSVLNLVLIPGVV